MMTRAEFDEELARLVVRAGYMATVSDIGSVAIRGALRNDDICDLWCDDAAAFVRRVEDIRAARVPYAGMASPRARVAPAGFTRADDEESWRAGAIDAPEWLCGGSCVSPMNGYVVQRIAQRGR